jgi:hypothetical protein
VTPLTIGRQRLLPEPRSQGAAIIMNEENHL